MEAHFARLQRDVQAGAVLLAGPCTDGAFGIVVCEGASDEAAQAYADADPAVLSGLMAPTSTPFASHSCAGAKAHPRTGTASGYWSETPGPCAPP